MPVITLQGGRRGGAVSGQGELRLVPSSLGPACPPHRHVSACFLQRERHKLSPPRSQQISVRKVRTRREEWERRKMGIEFMSDARTLEQAGSMRQDRTPGGFVVLLFDRQPQAPLCFGHPGRMCRRTDHAAWSALSLLTPRRCAAPPPRPCARSGPAGVCLSSVTNTASIPCRVSATAVRSEKAGTPSLLRRVPPLAQSRSSA